MDGRRPPSIGGLVATIVRLRLRSFRNSLGRSPRAPALRVAALFGLLVPVAYVGLFVTAFGAVGDAAGPAGQEAVLIAMAGGVVLASLAGKIASGPAALASEVETEFFLSRPVALPRLLVAFSLAAIVTDLLGALFLVPTLGAAGLAWGLGGRGLALAALTSAAVQVAVSASSAACQVALARWTPPRARRALSGGLALLAALTLALLWVLGTSLLRRPGALAAELVGWGNSPLLRPARFVAGPLLAARAGLLSGLWRWALLLPVVAGAVGLAYLISAWAARGGWELPGAAAFAPAARGSPRSGCALGPAGKDARLLLRDRGRLVGLLALPLIFVGVQVFGSAGWDWSTSGPRPVALLAYSLAAYAATLGPLGHMEAERRAFWILLSTPRPLGRIMAAKALFWSALLAGLAGTVYFGLLLAARRPASGSTGLLVLLGAAGTAWLAVGLGCGAADLSDDRKPALPPGTVALFLLGSGLFNVVLLEAGPARGRLLLLYAIAVGVCWAVGVARARSLYDSEAFSSRLPSATDGILLLILWGSGRRAILLVSAQLPGGGDAAALGFALLLGALLLVYLIRNRGVRATGGSWSGGALCVAAAGLLATLGPRAATPAPAALLIAQAFVEEALARGILQRGLAGLGGDMARALAAPLAALAALLATALPFGLPALAAACLPALALALSGRLSIAFATRAALLLGLLCGGV